MMNSSIAAEGEFMRMYEFYYGKIYNYVFFRLFDRQVTQDLLSDIFFKIFEHRASFDAKKAKLSTWIFNIAKNTLTDYYRKNGRVAAFTYIDGEEAACGCPNAEEMSLVMCDNNYMAECLSRLREVDRTVLYLKYFLDFDYKDIAAHLEVSEKNASVLLTRAVRRLKTVYEMEVQDAV